MNKKPCWVDTKTVCQGRCQREQAPEERPPGAEVQSVLWGGGRSGFWFCGVTVKNHCLGKVRMALMFKVGKYGKGTRQETSVTLKGGPETILIVVSFFFQTLQTVEIILLATDPVLLCHTFYFLISHFVSSARLLLH